MMTATFIYRAALGWPILNLSMYFWTKLGVPTTAPGTGRGHPMPGSELTPSPPHYTDQPLP